MNTALKEAFQTISRDQFDSDSAALQGYKQRFGVEDGVNNEKWLVMPRQFLRSATRFSLPINTQKLSTLTVFEYLSQYVWVSDHRKHLYRIVFNKFIDKSASDAQNDSDAMNDDDNDLDRDTPSQATHDQSVQVCVFKESVMLFKDLHNALTSILGYCGPVEKMAEKVTKIIESIELNENEHAVINFRSWCGLVSFAERYLNDLPFDEDPCDEVSLDLHEFLIKKLCREI